MDNFKKCQIHHVGVGGLKCPCCNIYFGKNKKLLNRMARARDKSDWKRTLKNLSY